MDNSVVLKGVIVLVCVLVFIFGISFLGYKVLSRYGKQKAGKIVGFGIFSIAMICTLYAMFGFPFLVFKNYYFLKSTAIEELKQVDVVLEDDFKIIENEVNQFMSYSHIFKLKISNNDVNRLIEDKKESTSKTIMVRLEEINSYNSIKVIVDTEENILIFRYEMD